MTDQHKTIEERQREIERLQAALYAEQFKDDGRLLRWYAARLRSGAADC